MLEFRSCVHSAVSSVKDETQLQICTKLSTILKLYLSIFISYLYSGALLRKILNFFLPKHSSYSLLIENKVH